MTDALEFLPDTAPVDPWRFLKAALGAPAALGVGGAVFILPFFAVRYGLAAYVIIGLPLMWLMLRNCPGLVARHGLAAFAGAGFLANLGTYPLYMLAGDAIFGWGAAVGHRALACATWGVLIGPVLALIFGWIYGFRAGADRLPESTPLPLPITPY